MQQKCTTWQAAIKLYTDAYFDGTVAAYPEPNSIFWTTPVSMVARMRRAVHRPRTVSIASVNSEDALWTELASESSHSAEELAEIFENVSLYQSDN